MTKPKNEFDLPSPCFLNQEKLKEQEAKIESGEIVCNIDAPEDCESCSG